MAKENNMRNQLVKDTTYQAVGMRFDLEDIKAMGLNTEKVRTGEVLSHVRSALKLPEKSRGTGKTKLMKAIASELTIEDLQKLSKQKGINVENL